MKKARARESGRGSSSSSDFTLALAVGNTSLFAGVFAGERRVKTFRLAPGELVRLPQRAGRKVTRAAVCSVVPALTPDVLRLIRRTWGVEADVLSAESSHGLRIGYRRPRELGADRVAAAMGGQALWPGENLIVVDCGTATTVTAVSGSGELRGGAILPGAALWPESLAQRTALLPKISVRRPATAVGRSPAEAIASGCFFGQVGAIREVVARVRKEVFGGRTARVVATGGNAELFADEGLFDAVEPALVLVGLKEFAGRTRRERNRDGVERRA